MTIVESIFLGIIQGITEFLPISSSGHLVLFQYYFELPSNTDLEIFLHLASLFAVLFFMRKKIYYIIKGLSPLFINTSENLAQKKKHNRFQQFIFSPYYYITKKTIRDKNSLQKELFARRMQMFLLVFFTTPFLTFILFKNLWLLIYKKQTISLNSDGILGLKLIVSTVFTIPLALVVSKYFIVISQIHIIAYMLLFTGSLIVFSEYFSSKDKKEFSWKIAIVLGLIQGFAPLPGLSRAGLTIAFLILVGIDKQKSAQISFLLAIPTILGAVILKGSSIFSIEHDWTSWLLAFLITFLCSLFAMQFLLKIVKKYWIIWAVYCFLLGSIILFSFI